MKKNNANKLQNTILIIADEIDRICKKNKISYFMIDGSLLGAVRHKGFIPWDDDFDIGMTRENYDKFLKICEKELNKEKFFIQNESTEKLCAIGFTKIQLLNTEIIEDFSKNVDVCHGIFVDIFPYDYITDNKVKKKIFLFFNVMIKNILWVKCGYGTNKHKKSIKYKLYKFIGLFFTVNKLKRIRNKHTSKYNNKKSKRKMFNSDYPNPIIDKTLLDKTKTYEFEDREFNGIYDYHSYLSAHYGNYMKLPDEKDRRVHSNYEIDYGPYDK